MAERRGVVANNAEVSSHPRPGFQSSGADAIIPNSDLAMGAGTVGIRSGGSPRPAQRLPENQRASEREERLVDVGPLVIPHAPTATVIEPGKLRSTTHRYRSNPLPCSVRRQWMSSIDWQLIQELVCFTRDPMPDKPLIWLGSSRGTCERFLPSHDG